MDLSEIRAKIDAVDEQLLELFLQRLALAEDVGRYKKANNLPILNTIREQEVLDKVSARAGDRADYACRMFSSLFALSRARQEEILAESSDDAKG